MRSWIRLAIALCLAALVGCQSLPQVGGGADARLAAILARQELRVGLSGRQPPLNMKNRAGELMGLEVELARVLAGSMGLRVRFVEKPFGELLTALRDDEVDLVISGMTITPERNAQVAFAGPYMISGKSVLTRSKTIANVTRATELNAANRTYAALAGSTSQKFVESAFPKAKLVTTADYDAAIEMVKKDQVDALIADFPICALSVARFPEAELWTLSTPFTIEPLGIALPADAPLFVNLVENYLKTLDASGTLVQLKAKWFNAGPWIAELP